MNCLIIPAQPNSAGAAASAAASDCDSAARFAELLKTSPAREISYVDSPVQTSAPNALLHALSEFQALGFDKPGAQGALGGRGADSVQQDSQAEHLADAGQEALQMQAQILRTTLMMETVSAARQGVSTLFQQQG